MSKIAHRKGALVYADIIQAAGVLPLDMRRMGIDFAACSGYKLARNGLMVSDLTLHRFGQQTRDERI